MSKKDWWKDAIFYQIYPKSFKDTNADGIGNLQGIKEKIPYIASLGVDAIWISPFYKSPMKDFGYDVANYREVDPIFGNLEDFDLMLKEAHSYNLRVIIDMVLSHTSDMHAWFKESRQNKTNPKSNWYIWANPKEDGTPPNNWLSVFGGTAWEYDCKRGQYYMHSFLKEQPDLNIRNEEVQEALLNEVEFWLKRGVDGFRLDAVNHCMHDDKLRDNPPKKIDWDNFKHCQYKNPCPYDMQHHIYDKSRPENLEFMTKLRKLTDKYKDKMMVAEIGGDDCIKLSAEYTATKDRIHTAYNFALLGWSDGAEEIKNAVEEFFSYADDYSWPAWAFSNHDFVRVASRNAPSNSENIAKRAKMLIALLCSLRGTIYLYQGEELGLTEADVPFELMQDPFGIFLYPDSKGRDGCRTPMVWDSKKLNAGFSRAKKTWLPIPKEHKKLAVNIQEQDSQSTLNFTRKFLKWRKKQIEILKGDIEFIKAEDNLLIFTRKLNNCKLLCAFNLGDSCISMDKKDKLDILVGYGLENSVLDNKNKIELLPFGVLFAKFI